jgi:hypothetical protein
MVRRPYERAGGCKWCGRPVTMVPIGYDDWDAIENGKIHVCPMRPQDWRSVAWRIATSNKMERRRLAAKCAFVVVLLLIALTLLVR